VVGLGCRQLHSHSIRQRMVYARCAGVSSSIICVPPYTPTPSQSLPTQNASFSKQFNFLKPKSLNRKLYRKMPFSLGQQMTRTACIFQGVIALPAMLVMGGTALQSLFTLEMPIYDFMSVPSITPSSSTSVSMCSCVHFNSQILT
jgi:hypothetical protein